jgi:ABC-type antimicrobial peptide transport system permease subunit
MAEDGFSDGMLVGLLIGIFVGIPLGWLIAQVVFKPTQTASSSVVFDRDTEGKIVGIHYVPVKSGNP